MHRQEENVIKKWSGGRIENRKWKDKLMDTYVIQHLVHIGHLCLYHSLVLVHSITHQGTQILWWGKAEGPQLQYTLVEAARLHYSPITDNIKQEKII